MARWSRPTLTATRWFPASRWKPTSSNCLASTALLLRKLTTLLLTRPCRLSLLLMLNLACTLFRLTVPEALLGAAGLGGGGDVVLALGDRRFGLPRRTANRLRNVHYDRGQLAWINVAVHEPPDYAARVGDPDDAAVARRIVAVA